MSRAKAERRARQRRIRALVALVITAAVLAALTADRGRIYPNVFIRRQAVGGLTRAEAREAAARMRLPEAHSMITVRVGEAAHAYAFKDTGLSFDMSRALAQAYLVGRSGAPLEQFLDRLATRFRRTVISVPVVIDSRRTARFIRVCAQRFNRQPTNATVRVEGSAVSLTPGRPGIEIDTDDAPVAMSAWAERDCPGELNMPARATGPDITAEQLRMIDTVLSSVRTPLSGSSRNRLHNIALAAEAVDGFILTPGEVFSYNQVVGPRTEDKGYRTAPVIVKGKLVPGTGGGACQLSSTLYQAALRAGLDIVSRSHHSHPVAYTPAGLDATVVYGAIDLKFRNDLAYPIALRARIESGRVACQVVGHGPAPKIELLRHVERIEPPEPEIVEDERLAVGERVVEATAMRGVRVRVTRRLVTDGGTEDTVVSNNYYAPRRATIREAVAATEPQPPPPATDAAPPPGAGAGARPAADNPASPPGQDTADRAKGPPKNDLR